MLSRVRGSSRASWWVTFVLLASLGGFWALGSVPTGAPDERDHVINASAVTHGDLVGDRLTAAQRAALGPGNGQKSAYRSLDAPELYGETNTNCFAFQKEVTGACLHLSGSTRIVPVVTNVSWYPPAYYTLVGLLTRPVPAGSKALYAMRLVTVALMAALLASAVASLRRGPSSRLRLLGFLGALTPMVLFLDASVNPNGPEITAGLALWASGAVLVDEVAAGTEPDGRLVRRVGIAAVVLALSRQDSLLWLGLIVALLLVLAGRRGIASLWHSTGVRIWITVVAVYSAAQVAWILVVGTLSADHSVFAPLDLPAHEAIRAAIGRSPEWYHEMIGTFGWLDTPSPALTVVIWTLVLGALLASRWHSDGGAGGSRPSSCSRSPSCCRSRSSSPRLWAGRPGTGRGGTRCRLRSGCRCSRRCRSNATARRPADARACSRSGWPSRSGSPRSSRSRRTCAGTPSATTATSGTSWTRSGHPPAARSSSRSASRSRWG